MYRRAAVGLNRLVGVPNPADLPSPSFGTTGPPTRPFAIRRVAYAEHAFTDRPFTSNVPSCRTGAARAKCLGRWSPAGASAG